MFSSYLLQYMSVHYAQYPAFYSVNICVLFLEPPPHALYERNSAQINFYHLFAPAFVLVFLVAFRMLMFAEVFVFTEVFPLSRSTGIINSV